MTEPIEYRNLITGDRAQALPVKRDHFELEIHLTDKANRYCFGTHEGDFLCAYAAQPTFKEAWFDALTHTEVGGEAYQAWESRPLPIDPGTQPDSPVYQGEGFDPYAGNLDYLNGY